MGIETLVPGPLKNPYRRIRSVFKNARLGRSNADVFDSIYRDGLWGRSNDGDVYSGSGTYDPSVDVYVAFVRDFIVNRQIKTVVEIGCGDFAIGRHYAPAVEHYLGVDVSALVIERNRTKFAAAGIAFAQLDASEGDLPPSDLCIIRQVLQHLDNGTIGKILARATAHKFVLITEHLPSPAKLAAPNVDKRAGPDTRVTFGSGIFVELPPFGRIGETVLSLPIADAQAGPGEVMRTTLLVNSAAAAGRPGAAANEAGCVDAR